MNKPKPIESHHSHRTLDRIENLKISIKLYRKSDQMILVDELVVRWQESVSLLDAQTPTDSLNTAPSSSPSKMSKKGKARKRRLFTLINEPNLEPISGSESIEKMDINQDFKASLKSSKGLERALESLQPSTSYAGRISEQLFAAMDQDVLGVTNPNRNQWSQIHKASVYSEMMIGVSLPAKTKLPSVEEGSLDDPSQQQPDPSQDIQEIICKIQYYGNGNLHISPNFTNKPSREMHEIHIGDDTYLYTIENVSTALSPTNEAKESLIFQEFFKRQHDLRMLKLNGQGFEGLPGSFYQRYCLNGEITSCTGFHSDVLYCQYLVDVPEEWKTDQGQVNLLSAHTQVSFATIQMGELDRTAYFGFPLEISLVSTEKSQRPLKIYVKVYTVDASDRHCIEGYGVAILPLEAGSVEFVVKTWRPLFNFQERLKSYFLGGHPDLIDFKFNNLEEIQRPFNRYGLQTEASGDVKMKFNIITQVDNPELRKIAIQNAVPEKLLAETNYALERAKLRLQTLKSMEAASPA